MNQFVKSFLIIFIEWLVLGAIVILIANGFSASISMGELIKHYVQYFAIFLLILYLNHFVLLPYLYFKKKRVLFYLIAAILVTVIAIIKPFEHYIGHVREQAGIQFFKNHQKDFEHFLHKDSIPPNMPPNEHLGPPPDMKFSDNKQKHIGPPPNWHPRFRKEERHIDPMSILLCVILIGAAIAIETNKRLRLSEQRVLTAEAARTKAELDFLKAQINPHFLFNTLNNIYAMSIAHREETSESIMRLSNIMRYATETISVDFVELNEELNFTTDYIYLQKLRGGKLLDLKYSIIGDPLGKKIAPLILLSFIENAFKYGISKRDISPILIKIEIGDDTLKFTVHNKIVNKNVMEESTGIGIKNTQRRLESLYPGKHILVIKEENAYFEVILTLPI